MALKIEIVDRTSGSFPIPHGFIGPWMEGLEELLRQRIPIDLRGKQISLVFVSLGFIQELNKKFRNKNQPTDILSFEGSGEDWDLGELVICGPKVQSQAKEHGLSEREELGYLLIHGVLHLLGYDHGRGDPKAEEMFLLQDKLFETLSQGILELEKRGGFGI